MHLPVHPCPFFPPSPPNHSFDFFHQRLVLPILEIHVNEITKCILLCLASSAPCRVYERAPPAAGANDCVVYHWAGGAPWWGEHPTVCLSILLLTVAGVVSTFRLSGINLLWDSVQICVCVSVVLICIFAYDWGSENLFPWVRAIHFFFYQLFVQIFGPFFRRVVGLFLLYFL